MTSQNFSSAPVKNVLDSLPLPILLLDQRGYIKFANQASEKLVRQGGLIGKGYIEFCQALQNLDEEEGKQCQVAIQEVLENQRSGFQLDYALAENQSTWYRMDVRRFEEGVIVSHQDISELKQAELQGQLLLESPLDAMLLVNTEGQIQLVNSRLEQLFGYSRDELFGQNLEMLIPHRFRRQHRGHMQRYFKDPETRPMGLNLELFALARSGKEFPVEISLNPIRVGRSMLVSAAIRDTSKQKLIEAERNRLGRIIEDSLNEVFLFDANSLCFIYANEGARNNLGYSEEELSILTPLDIKPDFDLAQFESLIAPLRSGQKSVVQFSTSHLRKDGSHYPVDVHLQLFAKESPPFFCAVIMDVSDRYETEKALRESQERMQEHLHHTPLAVIEWRVSDRIITAWNPASEKLFGYSAEEVLFKESVDIIVPDDTKDRLDAIWRGAIDKVARSANRNIAKDGRFLLCEWYNTVIKNDQDEIIGVAALGLDVTSRQRTLENLLSAQEEERARISRDLHDQVGQSLTGLSLNLSHAISGKSDADLDVFKEQTETILSDVRRISRDLRPALLDELGLEPAIKRLVRDLEEMSGLNIDVLIRLPDLAKDQQTVLYRVVQEALTNIARHAEASHASVTMTFQNEQIMLVVEDNGKGFDATKVVTTEHMGLAGMRERIELSGGILTIESVPGHGTSLSVRLTRRNP